MSACNGPSAPFPAVPVSKSRTFGELLSELPEELILQILEYTLVVPGTISKTEFWGGVCEWPSCPCQAEDGHWKHIPAEESTNNTLIPLLAALEPVPRLAQLVFYTSNTFQLCVPENNMDWECRVFWIPPQGICHWIRRLEVAIQIANPQLSPFSRYLEEHAVLDPIEDVRFLRRLQHGVHGFAALRSLKLMYEATFVTNDVLLRVLDKNLSILEPFYFQTPELILEACSAYPVSLDDDDMSGDIVRDERLERLLAKYVFATGKPQRTEEEGDRSGA